MLSLGIESTAHTFGVGICDEKGNILANAKSTYKPPKGKGIIPTDAAKHHRREAVSVLASALDRAGVKIEDIDIFCFSQGPGLPPCLNVGREVIRRIAGDKPIYGVNHCIAHIEIGLLKTGASDPVVCYVSGGNTQIIAFVANRYRCFGETIDIALGNALDMFAREAGLELPGGPKIEELAKNGKFVELPYVVKGMDLSFTGIITEAIKKLRTEYRLEDLCFSLQETCFAMLVEVTERAMAHTEKEEVLLTGGVAANRRLREMFEIMCKERGARFYVVPPELAGDNGAMIAWIGVLLHMTGSEPLNPERLEIKPKWRTDEVEIPWKGLKF